MISLKLTILNQTKINHNRLILSMDNLQFANNERWFCVPKTFYRYCRCGFIDNLIVSVTILAMLLLLMTMFSFLYCRWRTFYIVSCLFSLIMFMDKKEILISYRLIIFMIVAVQVCSSKLSCMDLVEEKTNSLFHFCN